MKYFVYVFIHKFQNPLHAVSTSTANIKRYTKPISLNLVYCNINRNIMKKDGIKFGWVSLSLSKVRYLHFSVCVLNFCAPHRSTR